jgi:WD40 repeat protein
MLKVHHSTGYAKNDGRGGIVSQSEINALFRVSSNSLAGCSCLRLPQIQGDYTLQADGTGTLVQLTLVNDILGTIQSAWTAVSAGVVRITLADVAEAFFYFANAATTVAGAMEVSVVTEWFGPIGGAFSPITDRANGATRYASFYITSDVNDTVTVSADGFALYDGGDGAYNAAADSPGTVSWDTELADIAFTANVPRLFWAKHEYNAADVGITETALSVSGESGLALLSGIRIAEDGQSGYRVYHATSGTAGGTLIEGAASFAAGTLSGSAGIWGASTGTKEEDFSGHTEAIYVCVFSRDGSRVLTCSADGTAKVWNASTGALVHTLTGHTGILVAGAISQDGSFCVTGALDKTAKIWSMTTGALLFTLSGHASFVRAIAIAPDSSFIVTASLDNTAKIWNPNTGALVHTLTGHSAALADVSISPDGTSILTVSADGTGKIWNASTGALVHTLSGHTDELRACAFSPSGAIAMTASADDTAKLWDVATGAVVHTLSGHTDYVVDCLFTPGGATCATASADGAAKVWNVTTGAVVHTLTGHTGAISSLSVTADGSYLASLGVDGNAKVWRMSDGGLVRTIAISDDDFVGEFSGVDSTVITVSSLPIRLPLTLPDSGTETHLYRVTYRNRYGVESPNQWLQYNIELDENGDLTAPPAPASLFVTLNPNGTLNVTAVSGAFRQESIEDYRWIVSDGTITQLRTITPRPGFAETYQELWGPFDWDDEITISVAIQDGRDRTSAALTETVTITSTSPSLPAQYAMTGLENGQYIALIDPYQDGDNWLDGGFGTAALYADGEKVLEVNVLEDGEVIDLHDYALVNGTVTGAGDAPFVVDGDNVYLCADGARIVEIDTVARTITAAQIVNDSTLSCPVAATYTEDSEGNVYYQVFSPVTNTWATWLRVDADGTLRLGFGVKQNE